MNFFTNYTLLLMFCILLLMIFILLLLCFILLMLFELSFLLCDLTHRQVVALTHFGIRMVTLI